mmetsp:Transcript_4516/g.11340  ORF Transcript_4516/g.11340 Transcript_4516/m.11340 type:complete len:456 (+) Transcript_4516:4646-6013(+)
MQNLVVLERVLCGDQVVVQTSDEMARHVDQVVQREVVERLIRAIGALVAHRTVVIRQKLALEVAGPELLEDLAARAGDHVVCHNVDVRVQSLLEVTAEEHLSEGVDHIPHGRQADGVRENARAKIPRPCRGDGQRVRPIGKRVVEDRPRELAQPRNAPVIASRRHEDYPREVVRLLLPQLVDHVQQRGGSSHAVRDGRNVHLEVLLLVNLAPHRHLVVTLLRRPRLRRLLPLAVPADIKLERLPPRRPFGRAVIWPCVRRHRQHLLVRAALLCGALLALLLLLAPCGLLPGSSGGEVGGVLGREEELLRGGLREGEEVCFRVEDVLGRVPEVPRPLRVIEQQVHVLHGLRQKVRVHVVPLLLARYVLNGRIAALGQRVRVERLEDRLSGKPIIVVTCSPVQIKSALDHLRAQGVLSKALLRLVRMKVECLRHKPIALPHGEEVVKQRLGVFQVPV